MPHRENTHRANTLSAALAAIVPVSADAAAEADERQSQLTKPRGSMGAGPATPPAASPSSRGYPPTERAPAPAGFTTPLAEPGASWPPADGAFTEPRPWVRVRSFSRQPAIPGVMKRGASPEPTRLLRAIRR